MIIQILFWFSISYGILLLMLQALLWNSAEKEIRMKVFGRGFALDAYSVLKMNYAYGIIVVVYCTGVIALIMFSDLAYAPIWPHLIIESICPLKCPACGKQINLFKRLFEKGYCCSQCGNTKI